MFRNRGERVLLSEIGTVPILSWPSPCTIGYINATLATVAKKATKEFSVTSPIGRSGGKRPSARAGSTTMTLSASVNGVPVGIIEVKG